MNPRDIPDDAIVISRRDLDQGGPVDLFSSLHDVVRRLRSALIHDDEISPVVFEYTDVYVYTIMVMDDGGHSDYAGNYLHGADECGVTGHAVRECARVRAGIEALGRPAALEVWDRFVAVENGPNDEYRLRNDRFTELDDQFDWDLQKANVERLLAHPKLVVLDNDQIDEYVAARKERSNYEARRRNAFAALPSDLLEEMTRFEKRADLVWATGSKTVDGTPVKTYHLRTQDPSRPTGGALLEFPDGTFRYEPPQW
ncbi:MAG: hypothetical protein QM809_10845 [Gordonia sp. (in: high G+C Gram-positive bacteria)]|uniref:hypothetical protein n=1 Tax=Gordonia sp. (in: high G+C Gram-positive bacteria) TaxID=84139 RepID=UPI0039E22F24